MADVTMLDRLIAAFRAPSRTDVTLDAGLIDSIAVVLEEVRADTDALLSEITRLHREIAVLRGDAALTQLRRRVEGAGCNVLILAAARRPAPAGPDGGSAA